MRKSLLLLLGLAGCFVSTLVFAQNYPVFIEAVPVASLNSDRLYSQSEYAKSLVVEPNNVAEALRLENDLIKQELQDEEMKLTDLRKTTEPAEFREIAETFDKKVTKIRQEQDKKFTDWNQSMEQARDTFFKNVVPVIVRYMRENGILFVLNEQSIYLAATDGDITDEVIAIVDQEFANK